MSEPDTHICCCCAACWYSGTAHAEPGSSSTEAQLVKSLQAINDNHLDIALNEVDSLLRVNPNFKLAQLVKGDLLMAHAGAIDNFGSAANAPHDEIKDLRDEARARLQRVLSQSDTKLSAALFVATGCAAEIRAGGRYQPLHVVRV